MNSSRNNALLLLGVGSVSLALLLWLTTGMTTGMIGLGILVVLVLPGYVLTEMLFSHQQLGWAERLLFVLGASLTVAVLGALLLNQLGWSLQTNTWLTLFLSVSGLGGVGAWLVRRPAPPTTWAPKRLSFGVTQLALIGLAVVITGVAFTTARSVAPMQPFQGYTMLWLAPNAASSTNRIQLGVDSKEVAPAQYKLQLKVNDQIAQEWSQIALAPNQQWLASFELPAAGATQRTVEALLYRLDAPETVYRHVLLRPQTSTR